MGDSGIKPAVRQVLVCWLAVLCAILIHLLASTGPSRAQQPEQQAADQNSEPIALPGKPLPPAHSKLSEHNILWLKRQPAQEQMEFLLGAAINHDEGATDLIAKHLEAWHGKLNRSQRWQDLETTALYSNDLRVRAAAIEINLIVNNLEKTDDTASRLIESADKDASSRGWYEWELGMLASRGVQPDRIHERLAAWLHDKDQKTRFWAVEGLAHIGTDDTISNFLDVLRNDPSMEVRERAGCSMAKSGMLTREQRMKAVPGLLEMTDDPSLNATTRSWVYQALREITDENLRDDPATWRNWYSSQGSRRTERFREGPSWALLGNR